MPDLTPDQAREALADIEMVARHTRRAVASSQMGDNLLLWGALWIVAFTLSHLSPVHTSRIWMVVGSLGMVATLGLGFREHRQGNVRSAQTRRLMAQVALFWLTVMVYAMALGMLLPLRNGADQLAVIVTVLMMAYVLMGIWVRSGLLAAIGLVVSVAALAGRAFLDFRGFLLWMAVFGGGGLFLPGLYIKLRWR